MSLENLEKYSYGHTLVQGEGVSANGDSTSSPLYQQSSLKRRRTEDYGEMGVYSSNKFNYICSEARGKTFMSIRHNSFVYQTEDWKPRGCTMYLPLTEDVMVNTRNIDQISFETDQFFLADEKGNYVGAKPGNAIHLWRFDPTSRKLYISRSVLFLKEQTTLFHSSLHLAKDILKSKKFKNQ